MNFVAPKTLPLGVTATGGGRQACSLSCPGVAKDFPLDDLSPPTPPLSRLPSSFSAPPLLCPLVLNSWLLAAWLAVRNSRRVGCRAKSSAKSRRATRQCRQNAQDAERREEDPRPTLSRGQRKLRTPCWWPSVSRRCVQIANASVKLGQMCPIPGTCETFCRPQKRRVFGGYSVGIRKVFEGIPACFVGILPPGPFAGPSFCRLCEREGRPEVSFL